MAAEYKLASTAFRDARDVEKFLGEQENKEGFQFIGMYQKHWRSMDGDYWQNFLVLRREL